MRILVATRNRGKVREIERALLGLGLEVVSLQSFPSLPDVEETGLTFSQNARIKSEYYFQSTGVTALADDSGLEVDCLGGRPGILSARYGPSDHARIQRLLKEMASSNDCRSLRRARFVCALCLTGEGFCLEVEGRVEGSIAEQPAGSEGFGYDPVFYYPPLAKTFGQLAPQEKERVSHRAAALEKLRDRLATLGTG